MVKIPVSPPVVVFKVRLFASHAPEACQRLEALVGQSPHASRMREGRGEQVEHCGMLNAGLQAHNTPGW
eukprot:9092933-Alexandrium_andersonii.AAC.1